MSDLDDRDGAMDRYVAQLSGEVSVLREQLAAMTKERDYLKNDAVREALAAYAHEAWSGWMRYMFSKCLNVVPEREHIGGEGSVIIPATSVKRWMRQMNTPYADLPEDEKKSDRKEADEILATISEATTAPSG